MLKNIQNNCKTSTRETQGVPQSALRPEVHKEDPLAITTRLQNHSYLAICRDLFLSISAKDDAGGANTDAQGKAAPSVAPLST